MSGTNEASPGRGPVGWLVAAVALLAAGLVVSIWFPAWALPLVAAASILLIVVVIREAVRTGSRGRRRTFEMRYSSLDDVRATLDLDELRAIRAAEGDLPTVREIRRRAPLVSLEQATEIARGL